VIPLTKQGTLTFNGQSIPMVFGALPSQVLNNTNGTQIGIGNLTVNSGFSTSGNYTNIPVYFYNGYYYVWPNGQFSMASISSYSSSPSTSSSSSIANMPAYGGGGTTTGGTSSGSGSTGSSSSNSSFSYASLPDGKYTMQFYATSPESTQPLTGKQMGIFNSVQIYSQYGVSSGVAGTYDNIPYYENSNGFYYCNVTTSNGSQKTFAIAYNGYGINESDALGTVSNEVSSSTSITVSPQNYTLTLSANPTSIQSGQQVTLTATISPVNSNVIGKSVTFLASTQLTNPTALTSTLLNPQTIGTATINSSGIATIQTSFTNTTGSSIKEYLQAQVSI
jgi:hypothetical protein